MAIRHCRSRRGLVAITAVLALVVLSAERCPRQAEIALSAAESEISGLLEEIGADGWRIHVYPKLVRSGQEIAAFSLTSFEIPRDSLTCQHRCLLFFVDTQPLAHFSHPTVIALFDLKTRETQAIKAEWWPTIDGHSVFYTVESRRDSSTILESHNVPPVPPKWVPEFRFMVEERDTVTPGEPSAGPGRVVHAMLPSAEAPLRDVHAVLVIGFDDPSDTFDEDVVGMYHTLRGHGVPKENIQVLSERDLRDVGIDHEGHQFSAEDLQNAIENALPDPPQLGVQRHPEFLLFYSSHGHGDATLACGTDPHHAENSRPHDDPDYVCACRLRKWLESLKGEPAITVVIEACHSGLFLDKFKESGFKDRLKMFVSAAPGETSAGDVDIASDKNPADSGSETIWGYVEAFGTRAADANSDGTVDLAEAVTYANDRDATYNHDGVNHPDTLPPEAVSGSDQIQPGGTLQVTFDDPCSQPTDDPGAACVNTVTRCCDAGVTLTIRNTADQPASMPLALRVFRTETDSQTGSEAEPDPAPQYFENDNWRTTVMVGGLGAHEETQLRIDLGEVPRSFHKGQEVTLQAVVDHLETPTGSGPNSGDATAAMKFKVRNCTLNACCWLFKSLCPD